MNTSHTLSGRIGGLDQLDPVRYAALAELDRTCIPPTDLLDALRDEQWADAAGVLLASAWAKRQPQRAVRLAQQIETGEVPQ